MTWGEQNDKKEAFSQMDCALDYGVNFDTAEFCSKATQEKKLDHFEKIIGDWLEERVSRESYISHKSNGEVWNEMA